MAQKLLLISTLLAVVFCAVVVEAQEGSLVMPTDPVSNLSRTLAIVVKIMVRLMQDLLSGGDVNDNNNSNFLDNVLGLRQPNFVWSTLSLKNPLSDFIALLAPLFLGNNVGTTVFIPNNTTGVPNNNPLNNMFDVNGINGLAGIPFIGPFLKMFG